MPRRNRICPPGMPVHLVQRGNNRSVCFTSDEDMAHYAHWLNKAAKKYSVAIHAWVFMTNHVHLLLTPDQSDSLSRMMQLLGSHYVYYFNTRYQRTGTLFEGRFKSNLVQNSEYLLNCQLYIELNPVRAGLVPNPGNYHWSSYHAHTFGVDADLWQPHDIYLALGPTARLRQDTYRELFSRSIKQAELNEIRRSLNTGLALGNETFRQQIEQLTGQPQYHQKPGPKPSAPNR